MSKQYRLLKDLPTAKAGLEMKRFDVLGLGYYDCNGLTLPDRLVEHNKDWFEEVKPFEWTDELVREYAVNLHTYYQKYSPDFPTIEEFKKSKQ